MARPYSMRMGPRWGGLCHADAILMGRVNYEDGPPSGPGRIRRRPDCRPETHAESSSHTLESLSAGITPRYVENVPIRCGGDLKQGSSGLVISDRPAVPRAAYGPSTAQAQSPILGLRQASLRVLWRHKAFGSSSRSFETGILPTPGRLSAILRSTGGAVINQERADDRG